jgi:SNF1-activating kinase 1
MRTWSRNRKVKLRSSVSPASIACPPSPDDETFPRGRLPPSQEETVTTTGSTSVTSFGGVESPLTSPSEITCPSEIASPVSASDFSGIKANSQQMLAFQSDPSLPALLSGASSVSNDLEAELLGQPGVVSTRPALLETTDSLTPPAMTKESMAGFPLEQALETTTSMESGIIPLQFNATGAHGAVQPTSTDLRTEEDDGDSDSDEGLQIRTKRKKLPSDAQGCHRTLFTARRRDTNASIGSTETAKKVMVQGDEVPPHPDH